MSATSRTVRSLGMGRDKDEASSRVEVEPCYDGQRQVMPEAPKGGRKTRTYFVPCPAVVIIARQAYSAAREYPSFASGCSRTRR